ncbi:MAG: hypothetical protein LUD81_10405 [Clostridiales bacterium]|nr:hypothetical protein [Clostridiales bacterium]
MNETFNTTVQELKEIKNFIAELEAQKAALEDTIKQQMREVGKTEVYTDLFKVTYKPVTSTRFDSKTFKAEHADLYTTYSKTSTYNRLTVA